MSKNRFAGLQAVKQLQDNKQAEPKKTVSSPRKVSPQTSVKSDLISNSSFEKNVPKRGRPPGKRSNAEFQQVTAYIRRDTYRQVSIKLIDREHKGEFSELIEKLLQKWLKEKI